MLAQDNGVGADREGTHPVYPGRDGTEPGPIDREGRQVGEVLADRDAGREQDRVHRPLTPAGVVNVERVNAG
jgi:hypothetical protein